MCACTHTHAAGKINAQHDRGGPATTAARELEEETHGLLPAALTLPLLPQCPVMYWHGGKMALYLLRCSDGELLPAMYTARVAGATYKRQGAAVCTRQGGALCAAWLLNTTDAAHELDGVRIGSTQANVRQQRYQRQSQHRK